MVITNFSKSNFDMQNHDTKKSHKLIGDPKSTIFLNFEKIFRHKTFLDQIANFIDKASMIFEVLSGGCRSCILLSK